MKKHGIALAWGALALGIWAAGCKGGDEASPSGASPGAGSTGSGFAKVQSILSAKCALCHGENGKEELDVRSYASLMKGSEHGPVVIAGDPKGSKLVKALHGEGMERMPKNANPLPDDEIKAIEDWIASGAKE